MTFIKKCTIFTLLFASSQLPAQVVKTESIQKSEHIISDDPARQNKEATPYTRDDISIAEPGNDSDLSKSIEESENAIYGMAGLQVQPEFPGGINKFFKFIDSKLEKPKYEGNPTKLKVYVTFIIEKDGSLSGIKALRDPGYQLAKETERVLALCPKWKPGIQNGKMVRVQFNLPIAIELP